MSINRCNDLESTIGDCGCSSYAGTYHSPLVKTASDCINQGRYPVPFPVGDNNYNYTQDCYNNIKTCYECYEVVDCSDYNNFPSGYCFTPSTTTTTTTSTTTTPLAQVDCLDLQSGLCCFPELKYLSPSGLSGLFPSGIIVGSPNGDPAYGCCVGTTTTTTTPRLAVTTTTTTVAPIPPTTTTTTTTPCPGLIDILTIQIYNDNSLKDDNFNVYLNNTYIGPLNLNQYAEVGSVFIASLNTTLNTAGAGFGLKNVYYFNPNLINKLSINTLEMRNAQVNNNGNQGAVKIIGYKKVNNALTSSCVLDSRVYNGSNGQSFTFTFNYNNCCNGLPTTSTTTTTTTTTCDPCLRLCSPVILAKQWSIPDGGTVSFDVNQINANFASQLAGCGNMVWQLIGYNNGNGFGNYGQGTINDDGTINGGVGGLISYTSTYTYSDGLNILAYTTCEGGSADQAYDTLPNSVKLPPGTPPPGSSDGD